MSEYYKKIAAALFVCSLGASTAIGSALETAQDKKIL